MTVIIQMAPPSSIKEVQSFIGMINYLIKFSLRLTKLSEPINADECFGHIKNLIVIAEDIMVIGNITTTKIMI